jgi:hypothetical protein
MVDRTAEESDVSAPLLFTAAEIGKALGKTKWAMLRALSKCPASATKAAGNNIAEAWGLLGLPAEIRASLRELQARFRVRTLEEVLTTPLPCWQPSLPLSRVSDRDLTKAAQLQRALARALTLPEGEPISERVRVAAEDFPSAMRYSVTERQLRTLITRTLDRDRGSLAWHRIELYLPDTPKAKDAHRAPAVAVARNAFPELDEALATIANPAALSPMDTAFCWRKIIECFSERAAAGADETKLKRELRAYVLNAAPFLAESGPALKRNFNRKLRTAEAEGIEALIDRRAETSGHRRQAPDWDENILLLAKWTRARQGRESQAWRELYCGTTPTGEQFSEAFRAHFSFDPRTAKSNVPAGVRAVLRPMIAATDDLALGPRRARVRLPSIHRDWSDTDAGDFYTSDDVTVNHYWWEESEFGDYEFEGMRFNVGRGQWLPVVDERTDNPLSFILLPNKNYSSWAIHTLNTRTFSDERVGLPFRGMKYERGVWMARNIKSQFSWAAIDEGFAREGVRLHLRHATTPKAKIIERVIGSAQNLMEHLPGYVGRDEMHVRFERMHKFLAQLKRVGQPRKGEVDPREMMLSKEQFADELTKTMRTFADEPQNGERLSGLSPAEAWRQLAPSRPHVVLPASLRYLLSTHQSEQTVTHEGVKVRVGALFNYYCGSEQLGALRGEKVNVFFNPELPEQVVIVHPKSDPRGVNAFAVPLFQRVPANSPTREHFAAARKDQNAFAKYGEATFRIIAPAHNLTMRNEGLGSVDLRAFGDRHNALEREQIDLTNSREAHRGDIGELAARQGVAIDPAKVRKPARVAASLRRSIALEDELRAMEAEGDGGDSVAAAKKTYTLKAAPPAAGKVTQRDIAAYWALWKKAEAASPGLDRHALTRRVLGYTKTHREFTRAEWAKLVGVFQSIAKQKAA